MNAVRMNPRVGSIGSSCAVDLTHEIVGEVCFEEHAMHKLQTPAGVNDALPVKTLQGRCLQSIWIDRYGIGGLREASGVS